MNIRSQKVRKALESPGVPLNASWESIWPQLIASPSGPFNNYPECLPVIRSVAGQICSYSDNQKQNKNGSKKNNIKKLFDFLNNFRLNPFIRPAVRKKTGEKILFVPIFDRKYCMDSCGAVMCEIEKSSPDVQLFLLTPNKLERDVNIVPNSAGWISVNQVMQMCPSIGVLLRCFPAFLKFFLNIWKSVELRQCFARSFGVFWPGRLLIKFLIHYRMVSSAKTWLGKNEITQVVTINDSVDTGGWIFGAAQNLGIRSHLIMHGISGPQNWPFLSDYCWVWGNQSLKALQKFGAPKDRLKVIGHLESDLEDWDCQLSDKFYFDSESKTKTLLILSQISANLSWKTTIFTELIEVACQAIQSSEITWTIMVRLHPSEGEKEKNQVLDICRKYNVGVIFSKALELRDDLRVCNFAFSVNSTALLASLQAGIPTAQFCPKSYQDKFGEPFCSSSLRVSCKADLQKLLILSPSTMSPLLSNNVKKILKNRGLVAKCAADFVLRSCKK